MKQLSSSFLFLPMAESMFKRINDAVKMPLLNTSFISLTGLITASLAISNIAIANPVTKSIDVEPPLILEKPKNIIFIISDGMGPEYTSAYRYFKDNPKTDNVETTIFDKLFIGSSSTYSNGTQEHHTRKTFVTDSAASATALSTGVKTYNQAVAVDTDDKPLETLMQYAKSIDKTTALVVTSQINHATPASFVTHNTYRYNYEKIADDFFDNRVNGHFTADLMFGGGQYYFIRPDRNIVKQFEQAGYQYFDSYEQLDNFDRIPALGLFDDKGIGFAIDNHQQRHRLKHMVNKALSLVGQNPQGFFMLIEASQVDWCGHDNDIACAMHEVDDLAAAVKTVKQYIDNNPDTLMVMTSDHSTGGLSIGANNEYLWDIPSVRLIRQSINQFTQEILKNADIPIKILWQNHIKIDISKSQLDIIEQTRVEALGIIHKNRNLEEEAINEIIAEQRIVVSRAIADIIAENTKTGWTSFGHTGGDVNVYSYGHSKQMFNGFQDNVDIGKKLFKLLGKSNAMN